MTRELTGVLAHEITHIAKHDAELMQLAGIIGQMTRLIAQVAIIIAVATWLLDIFGSGEGVDWLSLGVLVAAPIVANLILGASIAAARISGGSRSGRIDGRSGRARPRYRAN